MYLYVSIIVYKIPDPPEKKDTDDSTPLGGTPPRGCLGRRRAQDLVSVLSLPLVTVESARTGGEYCALR